ncbi:hypothetical protein PAHAL_8G017700 [Panicum hallii]|uniref:Uncharacterized protein n=1 Tax=Panicum hallii TaxID=206008 RepID=A0A2T8I769_9POAL|nr:hypothetical protein PAHAL_8G017700 [Panicum hallii]
MHIFGPLPLWGQLYMYLYLSKLVTVSGASGAIACLILDQFSHFHWSFHELTSHHCGETLSYSAKAEAEWLSSVLANWQLWIPFQFLNFYFVPQKFQVLAANFVALAWNVILTFKAHKEVTAK